MNHIILDMDDTLISMDTLGNPIPRPYLEHFIKFCFQNFKSVSIWTSASIDWFDIVNTIIFKPILDKYNFEFRFVWCFDKCTPRKRLTVNLLRTYTIYIKELSKVWGEYSDMNKLNTVIVDDNQFSFEENIDNAIHIKEWKLVENDTELIRLMILLKKLRYSSNMTTEDKSII